MSTIDTDNLPSVDEVVASVNSQQLIYCIRPKLVKATAEVFISSFKPGEVLYTVQCNTDPHILDAIWDGGVRNFHCGNISECATIRERFGLGAGIHFLNPIKASEDILEAYSKYGVKTFALDCVAELEKILSVVEKDDNDLKIIVRLALPAYCESENFEDPDDPDYKQPIKFGVEGVDEAAELLQLVYSHIKHVGIAFHVGSQCTEMDVLAEALDHASDVIAAAGVPIEIVDVGGGFPIRYEVRAHIPSLEEYFNTIRRGFKRMPKKFTENARLWCEPGRAMVGASCSIVIRIEDRRLKSDFPVLYVSDGIFGHLREASEDFGGGMPVRLIRRSQARTRSFAFFGPTCDSVDYMRGPFSLPSDVKAGDYVEVGQIGAYSTCFRTRFNGFDQVVVKLVRDKPILDTPGHPSIGD